MRAPKLCLRRVRFNSHGSAKMVFMRTSQAAQAMKRLALLLVLLSVTLHARADDASRRAKAQEMLALLHMDRMTTQMMEGIKQQMTAASKRVAGSAATPEKQQQLEAFQQRAFTLVEAQIAWKNLEPEYVNIYAKNFTEEELDGILAFYKSPVGVSLIAKMPQLTNEGMQLAQVKLVAIQPQLKQLFDDFAKSNAPGPAAAPKPPTP